MKNKQSLHRSKYACDLQDQKPPSLGMVRLGYIAVSAERGQLS